MAAFLYDVCKQFAFFFTDLPILATGFPIGNGIQPVYFQAGIVSPNPVIPFHPLFKTEINCS